MLLGWSWDFQAHQRLVAFQKNPCETNKIITTDTNKWCEHKNPYEPIIFNQSSLIISRPTDEIPCIFLI